MAATRSGASGPPRGFETRPGGADFLEGMIGYFGFFAPAGFGHAAVICFAVDDTLCSALATAHNCAVYAAALVDDCQCVIGYALRVQLLGDLGLQIIAWFHAGLCRSTRWKAQVLLRLSSEFHGGVARFLKRRVCTRLARRHYNHWGRHCREGRLFGMFRRAGGHICLETGSESRLVYRTD